MPEKMYSLSGKDSTYLNQETGWAIALKPWPHDLHQESAPCNLNEQYPQTYNSKKRMIKTLQKDCIRPWPKCFVFLVSYEVIWEFDTHRYHLAKQFQLR